MKISPISKTIHKIDLSGSFDSHTTPEFVEELDILSDLKPSYIIVDLASVTFIDSTALKALSRGMKRARHNGGELYLVNLRMPVRILLELTGMEHVFRIFPTAADALADIHAGT